MATRKKAAKKGRRKATRKKSAAKKKTRARARTRKSAPRKKRAAKKKTRTKRAPNPAFMKPMQPSAQLANVIGSSPMPRTEVTKKLWQYIKRRGLQDQRERRMINADENLKPIFNGRSKVSMFDMTKLVSKHLKPA